MISLRIEQIFESMGDSLALVSGQQSFTYTKLKLTTDYLIEKFEGHGIQANQLVAVYIKDPLLNVASIVALYRMGCGYIPLDPAYPEERLSYMVQKAEVSRVVCDTDFVNDTVEPIRLNSSDLEYEAGRPITSLASAAYGYVIYTSGSTGAPKGVEMPRAALDNLIHWQLSQAGFDKPARTAQFSAFSFDVSFQEIFTTLCSGGTLYLIDSAVKKDFRSLLEFVIENQVERIFMPYIALLNLVQWANRLQRWPQSLSQVVTAGEALIIDDGVRYFFNQTGAQLYNQYGPTESHVVTQYKLPPDIQSWESFPPIGSAINNTTIYLLDDQGSIINTCEEGEIFITGHCLANGYINNPDETQNKFTEISINGGKVRAYRTGDLGRWREDGELIYTGRIDDQVKISGYRIELAEVEACFLELPEVEAAAVAVEGSSSGDRSLVSFIIPSNENIDLDEVRNGLKQHLPHYMIPCHIVTRNEFDKTPSGKIDRKKMLEDYIQQRSEQNLQAPQANVNFSTDSILTILAQELKVDSLSADQNLIDQGMDSLTANRIVARFFDDLKLDVPAYRLFQYKSVGDLLSALDQSKNKESIFTSTSRDKTNAQGHDVAIIGMAVNVPGAETLSEFWDNLIEGKESLNGGVDDDGKISIRGLLKNPLGFDSGFFKVTPTEAEFIDPQQRIMLMLAWHALEDAGCVPEEFAGRIGVYCGTGNNTYYLNNVLKNTTKLDEYGELQAMVANEKDYTATRISHKLNLKGPSINILTACSTSLVSVHEAVKALRAGDCDLALAGGAAISFPQTNPYSYQEGGIFSKDGHTRAFDANSSGTVFSDGAGMVVLKRLDYAINDNDRIYAVISGAAVNNDGSDKGSFSAPSIEGQQNVIYAAHVDANITADQVDYIEAHGTATPLGDPIEVEALTNAFSFTTDKKQFCGLGSVKSNIGHLTAGAGVIGLIKSALSLNKKLIPPSINFEQVNPALSIDKSPFYVADKAIQLNNKKHLIGVSSFGIGGTNAHVILKMHTNNDEQETTESGLLPICISARSGDDLRAYLEKYKVWLSGENNINLQQSAFTSQQCRHHFRHRVSVPALNSQDALRYVEQFLKRGSTSSAFTAENIVFLFPGQGTQTINMGHYLYQGCDSFKKYFDQCAEILDEKFCIDIFECISAEHSALEQTENAQIALFTISYAFARTLQELNVQPTHMLGHSIGELSCAVIAGVFSLSDAIEVVVTRGQVMQSQPPGDMIAVTASAKILSEFTTDNVVLAADNSPDVCTLSGPSEDVKQVMAELDSANIDYKVLNTSHAFHSPLMQGAYNEFITALSHIKCNSPNIPFISCVTGNWISEDQATDISYWAGQIISTVNFRCGVEKLSKLDNVLLIEAGPRKTLAGLSLQNLIGKNDYRIVSMLPDAGVPGLEIENFAVAIGKIWEASVDIDWTEIYQENSRKKVDIPVYPFNLKQYFIEPEKLSVQTSMSNPGLNLLQTMPLIQAQQTRPVLSSPDLETTMNNSILEQLKVLFADASGLDLSDSDNTTNFFELGLDSLFLTQASLSIKKEFKVNVTFRQLLNECNNFEKLEKFLIDAGVKVAEPAPQVAQAMPSQPEVPLQQPVSGFSQIPADVNALLMQQMQLINNQLQVLSLSMSTGQVLTEPSNQPQASVQTQSQTTPVSNEQQAQSKSKPFGAAVRINAKRSNELTSRQSEHLADLTARYTSRLKKSKAFAQENRKQLADPRVVSGFRSTLKELIFPIVVEKSKGAYLWDIDGNRYVDITCGFGSNFFGNGADFIKNEIARQLEVGYEIGPQSPLVADVSRMFCEMTQSERVAFCNTGSEAVLGAIRLARTVTAKDKIVMFESDYHGINDEVIVTRGRNGQPLPAAAGVPPEHVSNTIILDYGDTNSLSFIRENVDEIAAVVVEPVQSRNPELQPREFLQELRKICTDGETVLVFDEVITGLRLGPMGAQGYFDVQADLATYGKVIGGGMPIGIIAGKHEYMDALDGGYWSFGDESAPEVGVTYFAGTFVRHPLAMAAARAVLTHLKENPGLQQDMNIKTEVMVKELNDYCEQVGAPVKIPHCGSLFKIKIPQEIPYEELFYVLMREKGIHIWDARPCFITTAHTDDDIRFFINNFKQSVDEMLELGFLPVNRGVVTKKKMSFDADKPPVEGARIGKKPNGDPAWFIEDPDKPGKYKIVTYQ